MYEISIKGKEVQTYTVKYGTEGMALSSSINLTELVSGPISKEIILERVCKLLNSDPKRHNLDSLFDGNVLFYVFNRLEDSEGNELTNTNDGWSAEYYVFINKIEEVNIAIIPEYLVPPLPVMFHYGPNISGEEPNKNYKIGDDVVYDGQLWTIDDIHEARLMSRPTIGKSYLAVYLEPRTVRLS